MTEHANREPRDMTRAVLIAAIGSALAVVPVWLIGGLGVQISADLGLSEAQFGVVAGSFMTASALLSIPGGMLVRRHGWGRGFRWAALATGGACLGIALTTGPWFWLLGFIGLAGASHTLGQPSANLILVQEVPKLRQGVAFGVKQSSVPLGTLAAGLAVPLVGTTIGWRWAFVAVSLACLLLVLAIRRSAGTTVSKTCLRPPAGTSIPTDLRRPLIVIALGGGFGTAASNSLGAFVVLYAASLGLDSRSGGILLALGSIANIIVRISLGRLADRRETDHLRWVGVMMLMGTGTFVAMALAASPAVLIVVVIGAFMFGWGWNGLYHLGVVSRYHAATATATGVIGLFLSIGGAAGPMLVGLVADQLSFAVAWLVVGGLTTAAGGLVLLGARLNTLAQLRRPDPGAGGRPAVAGRPVPPEATCS